jgi:AcrR family transcriptional regulator
MTKTDLHARLIHEAMLILAENPEDLTLRAVARAAGVSAMAPYRHFADKAALLGAVVEEGFDRLRMVLRQADEMAGEEGKGRAALVAQGLAYLEFALAHPALFRLMFSGRAEKPLGPAMGDTAYGVLAGRVAKIAPPAQASVVTTAAWSLVHGMATLMLDGRLPREEAHARAVMALFVAGLGR